MSFHVDDAPFDPKQHNAPRARDTRHVSQPSKRWVVGWRDERWISLMQVTEMLHNCCAG
jgi:hypothetical protein